MSDLAWRATLALACALALLALGCLGPRRKPAQRWPPTREAVPHHDADDDFSERLDA